MSFASMGGRCGNRLAGLSAAALFTQSRHIADYFPELSPPGSGDNPFIAMTANTFQEDIQKCLEAGMCAHLAKPMNVEKLKHTIRSQIHKE